MNVKAFLNEIPAKSHEIRVLQNIHMTGSLNEDRIRKLTADIELGCQIINSVHTEKYRKLLAIRFLSDQGRPVRWKDIARAMGFSVSHVRGHLYRKAIAEAEEVVNMMEERKV